MLNAEATEPIDVVLRDGSTAQLRVATAADRSSLLRFLTALSPESLHDRFFSVARVSAGLVDRLLAAGGAESCSLIAERGGSVMALASWVRLREAADRAEVAFVVADGSHGVGLGTRMLERLAEIARDAGIAVFDAFVLPYNARMLDVFKQSGLATETAIEGGLTRVRMDIREAGRLAERAAMRAEAAASASIRPFLTPASIAVIGASRDPGKIGGAVLRNLRDGGFRGAVYPVNPNATAIDGTVARIADIPAAVDLAIITVPAPVVEGVVEECVEKRVKGIVIVSAGFSEASPEGGDREQRVIRLVRNAGVRLIGPNCLGVLNTAPEVRLNATFARVTPPEGHIAFMSQSGALGLSILEQARALGLGLSSFVSVGNKADVSGNDLLQYWAQDPATSVILLYLESFGNPRKFSRIARRVARQKPIVAVKAGRSRAGARAAASHTGALAVDDAVVDALFEQAGVIRTRTLEELFDAARLLERGKLPRGRRVAIVTNAGGPGILAADACEAEGLEVPPLSDTTRAALRALAPRAASVGNPVDLLASATADDYRGALEVVTSDPDVDSIIAMFIPVLDADTARVASVVKDVAVTDKPVLATLTGWTGPPPAACFRFPEAAATALARMTTYARWRERDPGIVRVFPDMNRAELETTLAGALACPEPGRGGEGGRWLTATEVARVLKGAGIPLLRSEVATSEDAAVAAGRALGWPCALKALGRTIVHKTEVGGVRLNLADEKSVLAAYRDMRERLSASLEGVLVQPMAPEAPEVLIGAVHHETFGPLVACGTGGTLAEILDDVVFRLQPITDRDASEMLDEMRGMRLLRGYRGRPPADVAALRDVLLRVSYLLEVCPAVQELDLNPLRVLPQGVIVLDARISVGPPPRPSSSRRVSY